MNRKDVLKHPAYWFEHEQNELFRQVSAYMKKEGINQSELAERLNVSKGYVSQILNGNCNFSLKKWIELCLAIGIVPAGYKNIEDVIKEDLDYSEKKIDVIIKVEASVYTHPATLARSTKLLLAYK